MPTSWDSALGGAREIVYWDLNTQCYKKASLAKFLETHSLCVPVSPLPLLLLPRTLPAPIPLCFTHVCCCCAEHWLQRVV
ncbi:hypothetical protein OAN61_00715 [bacterium]|nr:hypothetical protein [bacterium]